MDSFSWQFVRGLLQPICTLVPALSHSLLLSSREGLTVLPKPGACVGAYRGTSFPLFVQCLIITMVRVLPSQMRMLQSFLILWEDLPPSLPQLRWPCLCLQCFGGKLPRTTRTSGRLANKIGSLYSTFVEFMLNKLSICFVLFCFAEFKFTEITFGEFKFVKFFLNNLS